MAGIGVFLAVILVGAGTPTIHMMLLVFLLLICGIPHGALDYHIGYKTFRRRLGRRWAVWFVTTYLIVMLVVTAVWMVKPVWSLFAFLLLTLYHFGTGDAIPIVKTPLAFRFTEVIARGGMVITFPALVARAEVIELFSYLVPDSGAATLTGGLANVVPLVSACMLLTAGWGMIEFVRFRNPVSIGRVMELLTTALIFLNLPPMLAFTIYFSVLHSLRHMLAVADRQPEGTLFTPLTVAFRLALPVTIVTLVIGAVAYMLLGGLSFDMSSLMKVVFIGIASMTYPHVVLIDVAKRLGTIAGQTRSEYDDLVARFADAREALTNEKS
jgi:Brp/Blh family beta-carotene 15,15'-monooxygenase